MLRFQAQSGSITEHRAGARGLTVQKIARIKLQSRLCGTDFERASAVRLREHGREGQCSGPSLVEDPVVIVAVSEVQLLIRIVNPAADGVRTAKIEWCARH